MDLLTDLQAELTLAPVQCHHVATDTVYQVYIYIYLGLLPLIMMQFSFLDAFTEFKPTGIS